MSKVIVLATDGAACPPMRSLIDRERCTEPSVGCYTFYWQATVWSTCLARQGSTRCGHHAGIQQRDVYCADGSGHRVPVKRYAYIIDWRSATEFFSIPKVKP